MKLAGITITSCERKIPLFFLENYQKVKGYLALNLGWVSKERRALQAAE
jgi:hypothetical protein